MVPIRLPWLVIRVTFDFPWVEWAHRDRKEGICDYEKSKENLYLKFSPNNSGLSGLTIRKL